MISNLKVSDYKNAVNEIADHFTSALVSDSLKPLNLIRNGSINSPGVSDLDLIFVFENDFEGGSAFYKEYYKFVNRMKNKNVFFIHDPMIVSHDILKDLPYYTKNPSADFEFFLGDKPKFSFNEVGKLQACLICIEFIQFRMVQLMDMIATKKMNMQGILLRGHSLKHSIELCQHAGIDLTNLKFPGFNKVELLRDKVKSGKTANLSSLQCKQLYQNIVDEFHEVYKKAAGLLEKFVNFYSPESFSYLYDKNIMANSSLDYMKQKPSLKVRQGRYEYSGLSWLNMMLSNIYFDKGCKDALVMKSELSEEALKRRDFFIKVWRWNYTNFKKISAGLSPMPCLIGEELEFKALKLINVNYNLS